MCNNRKGSLKEAYEEHFGLLVAHWPEGLENPTNQEKRTNYAIEVDIIPPKGARNYC